MKKKFLGLLLAFVLCLSVLPTVKVSALTSGDYEYTLSNNEVTITKYIGEGGDVVIPSAISGAPVTEIGSSAFFLNEKITSVVIPSTVSEIGNYAFERCSSLTDVTIPNSVTVMGKSVFSGCKSLKSCILPDSITSIGQCVFSGCSSLISSNFPKGVKEAEGTHGEGFWSKCTSLTNVSLPEGLEVLGPYAFYECTSLESISFPNTLKRIGMDAFEGCTLLKSAELNYGLETISSYAFVKTNLDSIIIPVTVKEITGNPTFTNYKQEEIILPYGLESFGSSSFQSDALKALYVPSTVDSFGAYGLKLFAKSHPNAIIYCPEGSAVAAQCKEYGLSYVIDNSVDSAIHIMCNGKRISFDVNPTVVNGRTLVPLRAIFESMGASVDWDDSTQTVTATRGGTTIKLTVGSNTMYVNGTALTLDVPAQIISGRTMVPARAIAESFNATVTWNGVGGIVFINE